MIIPFPREADWPPRLWKSYYKVMRERIIRGDALIPPEQYKKQVEERGNARFGKPSCRPDWCPPDVYRRWLARNAYNRAHKKPEIYLHTMPGIDRQLLEEKNSRIKLRMGITD